MAGSAKLSELFIDITLRGGAMAQIKAVKEQIESTDKALKNNAAFYELATNAKIGQMGRLAENQEQLAKIDQRTYGKLPYSGYADKQAKADIESEIAGKQKMVALSQAELRALQGKRGMELAQKTVQADRVKKQVEEIKNQQMLIAQYGKLGATIRQVGSMATMTEAIKFLGPIGAIVGAAMATAPAASPVHADMLSKSFELLSAQIGTLLLPVIVDLSKGMQDLSKFVDWINKHAPEGAFSVSAAIPGVPGNFAAQVVAAASGKPIPAGASNQPDRPASMPAHFEQFDQAWRRIQQQAASTGPLEQQILDVQMRNLEKLNQIAENTTPRPAPSPPVVPPGGTGP